MAKQVIMDFGNFQLTAELFDTKIAGSFYNNLPYDVELTQWGDELYGPIGKDLDFGAEKPVPEIPAGGLVYTNRGNYICIFYGQTPAWAVEHIGRITGDDWKKLLKGTIHQGLRTQVKIKKLEAR